MCLSRTRFLRCGFWSMAFAVVLVAFNGLRRLRNSAPTTSEPSPGSLSRPFLQTVFCFISATAERGHNIKKQEIWPRMLRNALTIGFNDALISISNNRFKTGNIDLWKEMKQGGFPDLIKEENNQNLLKSIPEKVKALINSTDIDSSFN